METIYQKDLVTTILNLTYSLFFPLHIKKCTHHIGEMSMLSFEICIFLFFPHCSRQYYF